MQNQELSKLASLRLTLQRKYTLTFSLIFLGVIIYLILSILASEEREFVEFANENFKAIFLAINAMGEEAMSVGTRDRLALQTTLQNIFNSDLKGLEQIFFVRYNPQKNEYRYFAYRDREGDKHTDSLLTKEELAQLKARASQFQTLEEEKVYLVQKIIYKTAVKDVFLGYSQLVFSYQPIRMLIATRRQHNLMLGLLSFVLALVVVSVVTALLIRRIKRLNEATKEVSKGKLDTVPVSGSDEVAELMESYNEMILGLRERLLMTRYVSQSTIGLIREKRWAGELELSGIRELVCVFFSDIRGFTRFSEQHDAQQVLDYLNSLLNMQVECVQRYGGDVDKFIGDGMLAVFKGDGKEQRAILAAIDIQRAVSALVVEKPVFQGLRIGIGINAGEVVAGNVGSRHRMNYTVIGDVVNTASRVCGAAAAGEILITEFVKTALPEGSFALSEPFTIPMKNKSKPINLYKVHYD